MFISENSAGRVAGIYGDARTAGFLIKPAGVRVFELAFHIGDKRPPLGDDGRQAVSLGLRNFFLQSGNFLAGRFFLGFSGGFGGDAFYFRLFDFFLPRFLFRPPVFLFPSLWFFPNLWFFCPGLFERDSILLLFFPARLAGRTNIYCFF